MRRIKEQWQDLIHAVQEHIDWALARQQQPGARRKRKISRPLSERATDGDGGD